MSNAGCITVFVTVKISADRVDAFLEAMKIDVEGSRKEEGCIRFDLLKGEEEGVYHFYEVYKDAAAMAFHKEQAHYKAWADFKAAGGVESQVCALSRNPLIHASDIQHPQSAYRLNGAALAAECLAPSPSALPDCAAVTLVLFFSLFLVELLRAQTVAKGSGLNVQ